MKYNITIIILLSFLSNITAQVLGKVEVTNETTSTIDKEYFAFSNAPKVVDDPFMEKSIFI